LAKLALKVIFTINISKPAGAFNGLGIFRSDRQIGFIGLLVAFININQFLNKSSLHILKNDL